MCTLKSEYNKYESHPKKYVIINVEKEKTSSDFRRGGGIEAGTGRKT